LIAYGAGRLTGGLAGCLALSAAAGFQGILQGHTAERFDVFLFHNNFPLF
jgi:hypothetical protein